MASLLSATDILPSLADDSTNNRVSTLTLNKEPTRFQSESTNGSNRIHVCDSCHDAFTDAEQLAAHVSSSHVNSPHVTSTRQVSSASVSNVLASPQAPQVPPASSKVMRGLHICKVCEEDFPTYLVLKSHMLTHSKEKSYKCDACGKGFIFRFDLKKHRKTHTKEKVYTCEVCQKTYQKRRNFENHRETHLTRPLVCKRCNCEFADRKTLKEHMRAHRGGSEKSHHCEICNKNFSSKSYLKKHIVLHQKPQTTRKRITISIGGKMRMTTRGRERRHFKCEYCPKKFLAKNMLKRHLLSHTKEKPYKCEVCGKGFSLDYNLRAHELTHGTEKPYQCEKCDKGFYQSSNYKKHKLTHVKKETKKPYKCKVCRKGFTKRDKFRDHMDTHDDDESSSTSTYEDD